MKPKDNYGINLNQLASLAKNNPKYSQLYLGLSQIDIYITKFIGNIIEEINEDLEQVDVERPVPPFENLEKICTNLESLCLKLENEFLYDSIPINQIRNLEEWAYKKSEEGKKTIILENSERMSQNVRNALLKILEEPPEDCVFILLTSNRNAIMQTILSRVRTYSFVERTIEQQQDVITRVFHNNTENITINPTDIISPIITAPILIIPVFVK